MDPLTASLLAGGLLQVGTGMYADKKRREGADLAYARQIDAQREASGLMDTAFDEASGMYDRDLALGDEFLNQYEQGVRSGEYLSPDFQVPTYDKTVHDFLDPNIAYQQDQARQQLEASRANAGSLYSGSAMDELQKRAMDIGNEGYGTAYDRRLADEKKNYGYYIDKFNSDRARTQEQLALVQDMIQRGDSARGNVSNMGIQTATGQANMLTGVGNLQSQRDALPYQTQANAIEAIGKFGNQGLNIYGGYLQDSPQTPVQNVGGAYPYRNSVSRPVTGINSVGGSTALGSNPAYTNYIPNDGLGRINRGNI